MIRVPSVAVMAGGTSRRMGRDKALLVSPDTAETWLARTVRIAQEAHADVFVVGRTLPPEDQLSKPNVTYLLDREADLGPLGGLATALAACTVNTDVIACACDMPRLSSAAFTWLFERAAEAPSAMGVALSSRGELEPLFSLYRPSCLPLVETQLAARALALRALLLRGDFVRVDAPSWLADALVNVNTPDEWEALRQ